MTIAYITLSTFFDNSTLISSLLKSYIYFLCHNTAAGCRFI